MAFTTCQISRAGVRYVYVLNKSGNVLHLEQAYDCGHGGKLISDRLVKAGYPYSAASNANWATQVRRTFQAKHDPSP